LIQWFDVNGGNDQFLGGSANDLLIGDDQTLVAAYLGLFSSPLAAGVTVRGERLVVDLDVLAGRDTLRGGDGDDALVGDSDTTAAIAGAGGSAVVGSFAMTRLIDDLSAGAGSDTEYGDAGKNLLEQGNRASLGSGLVGKSNISSLSKTSTPAALPVIDWNGQACASGDTQKSSWAEDFVNGLGGAPNPNGAIRIKL
jgi:Ca2+-binding RTX toxin-like protein